MANDLYKSFRLNMAVAGSMVIGLQADYFKIQNMELNGALDLAGYIRFRPEAATNLDFLTMYLNHEWVGPFSRIEIEWDAQPDTFATVFIGDYAKARVGAPPAKQLVTSSVGSVLIPEAVAVDDTATEIAAANGARQSVSIFNMAGGATIYIGDAGVTAATGTPVEAGSAWVIDKTTAAVYAICETAGDADVRVLVEA